MTRMGRGTGSVRRRRWDAMFAGWPTCQHKCPKHGVWRHKAVPGGACHFRVFAECEKCLEWPLMESER